MPFFPSLARDRSTGRWPTRSLLDNALAVAAVALLLVGLSGAVRGALAGLMAEVEGAWTIVLMR
ncbi:hypothetical protein [Azospirillum sp. TSA6c]|uniref:hypothetical protein n=1 Tax=unclassified Azospirillum TaxID=2630922 RepID=UPI000D60FF73|nr:hypothetical protein [Azospirillum sp. TSA6c]PWC45939.1 hypothetical protein TSA6c_03120 [Azospirillum sp. TSA6c]